MDDIDLKLQTLLAQEKGLPVVQPSSTEQEKYLSGYSWSALFYNYFYFRAMEDKEFAWLSAIAGLTGFLAPILIILPFFARRRAWERRQWQGFTHFQSVQRTWDRSTIYSGVFILIAFYALYKIALSSIMPLLHSIDPTGANSTTLSPQTIEQLKQNVGDVIN